MAEFELLLECCGKATALQKQLQASPRFCVIKKREEPQRFFSLGKKLRLLA
jgi:hypothetical protein